MLGILAFGSLRADPGCELEDVIAARRSVITPFPVEYARYSGIRRGAPTLVPVEVGCAVEAEILVLRPYITIEEARNMLWRRETRQEGSGKEYRRPANPGANSVLVEEERGFDGLTNVLYTDFPPEGKITNPDPRRLAQKAIESVMFAELGRDGISYLIEAKAAGVATELAPQYEAEILHQTRSSTLSEARQRVRTTRRAQ